MAKPIVEKVKKDISVWWQQTDEEYGGVGEPALIVREYTGMIAITQEDDEVLINLSTLPELIKCFNAILRAEKEGK